MAAHDHINHNHPHSNRRATRPHQVGGSRRRTVGVKAPTSLQVLESTFRLVTTGPDPLMVDGAAIGHGLPRRRIGLDELRTILAHPATSRPCREAVWRYLALNARTQGPSWLIGAAGVALPDLEPMAAGLTDSVGGDVQRLYSAVLAGFIEGLRTIEITQPRLIVRLRWMAYRAAIKSRHHRTDCLVPSTDTRSRPGLLADPEAALFDAVARGTVSPLQGELIARIRIDKLSIADAAAQLGVSVAAVRAALQRGEAALAATIDNDGDSGHRRSGPARSSGRAAAAGPACELGGVRGRSTCSDGTSEFGRSADLDEEGVFCGPAHHPTPRETTSPARRERAVRPGHMRTRCIHARDGGPCDRSGGGSS